MKPGKDQTRLRTEPTKPVPYRNGRIFFFLDALSTYRRSGNFRVIKFSCFKFSRKNIFVVQDTHENFLTVLRSQVQRSGTKLRTLRVRTACMLRSWLQCSCWRTTSVHKGTE